MSVPVGRPSRFRRTAGALASVLLVVGTASCSVVDRDDPELRAEPVPSASTPTGEPSRGSRGGGDRVEPVLAPYYDQVVDWSSCREKMQCAEIEVPLDYAEPDGRAITLSLLRVPATDDDRRIGSLVVNPGGPGASGVDYAANAGTYFGDEVRAVFDVVGFDPRGVGGSTPIDCLTDPEMDVYIASDPDPDDPAEARASDALIRDFGRGCLQRSGDLTRHVSTVEAARDMDVLRAVLDEDRLTYFGASYGTFLGGTYADLFPERVGRMVLDGAVDPAKGAVETSLVQAKGFQVALDAYVSACVDDGGCYLGDSVEDGLGTIDDFLDRLDADPIPGAGNRELTEGLAVLGIWLPLYNRDYWSILDAALQQGLEGKGAALMSLADSYVSRGPNGYNDNSTEALYAVNCLDHDEKVSLSEARRLEPRFTKVSPTFGRIFAFGLTACGSWPVHTGKKPQELRAAGAAPILVVGTSRDPATPLSWAEALAEQLESGVLVRRDGDGHTGYRAGNECVDDVVERYLVSGEVPEGDVDC